MFVQVGLDEIKAGSINAGDVEDERKLATRRRTVLVAAGSSSSREKSGSSRQARGARRLAVA